MILQELTLSWGVITTVAAIIFAFGGNYWLLIHIGKEGSRIKEKVENHAQMHVDHKNKIESISDRMHLIQNDAHEIKQDIKVLLQRK